MSGTRAPFQQNQDASCHQVSFPARQGTKEIHAILTETLACFLPGWARDLSALLYLSIYQLKTSKFADN